MALLEFLTERHIFQLFNHSYGSSLNFFFPFTNVLEWQTPDLDLIQLWSCCLYI